MINKQSIQFFSTIVIGLLFLTACGQKGELYLKNSSAVVDNDKFLLHKAKIQPKRVENNLKTDKILQENIEKMQKNPNDY